MTTLNVKNSTGAAAGELQIDDAWLVRDKGEQAVHDTVVSYLAAQRANTARAKNRTKVRGGGAKPYRQKGTGHARAGSNRSPIWRGGGVIFGPTKRNYGKKVNKKVRQLALRRAFTERVDAGDVILVDKIELAEPKTKDLVQILKALDAGDNVLIVDAEIPSQLLLSARNMQKTDTAAAREVNVYQLLLHRKVVITGAGMEALGARLS